MSSQSRECLLRYLRAAKWIEATAITRLEDTLKWRREFGLYDKVTPEHVENEVGVLYASLDNA
jgi:hypothetical protein